MAEFVVCVEADDVCEAVDLFSGECEGDKNDNTNREVLQLQRQTNHLQINQNKCLYAGQHSLTFVLYVFRSSGKRWYNDWTNIISNVLH